MADGDRPTSPRSPPTTRTTCAPRWHCATGWSRIGQRRPAWRDGAVSSRAKSRRARRAGRGASRVRCGHCRAPPRRSARLLAPRMARPTSRRRLAKLNEDTRRTCSTTARRHRRAWRPVELQNRRNRQGTRTSLPAMRFTFPPQSLDGSRMVTRHVLYLLHRSGQWTTHRYRSPRPRRGRDRPPVGQAEAGVGSPAARGRATTGSMTEAKGSASVRISPSRCSDGSTQRGDRVALLRRELPAFRGGGGRGRGRLHRRPRRDARVGRPNSTTVTWRSKGRRAPVRPTAPRTWCTPDRLRAQRVGITAMSHAAIDNLLEEILESSPRRAISRNLHAGAQTTQRTRRTAGRCQVRRQRGLRTNRVQSRRRDDVAVRSPRRCATRRSTSRSSTRPASCRSGRRAGRFGCRPAT